MDGVDKCKAFYANKWAKPLCERGIAIDGNKPKEVCLQDVLDDRGVGRRGVGKWLFDPKNYGVCADGTVLNCVLEYMEGRPGVSTGTSSNRTVTLNAGWFGAGASSGGSLTYTWTPKTGMNALCLEAGTQAADGCRTQFGDIEGHCSRWCE